MESLPHPLLSGAHEAVVLPGCEVVLFENNAQTDNSRTGLSYEREIPR